MTRNGGRNDEILAAHLAAGLTVQEAAEAARLSPRTVGRKLQEPAFRRRLQEIRAEIADRVCGQLVNAATEAARVLQELLSASSDNIRLSAAKEILSAASRARSDGEFEQRIRELEEAAQTTRSAPSTSTKGDSK